jgi:hypothetical protein
MFKYFRAFASNDYNRINLMGMCMYGMCRKSKNKLGEKWGCERGKTGFLGV